ncbi:MAG: hypothetical protein QW674_05610 [Candidatus Bathyarchaeia archaeon]
MGSSGKVLLVGDNPFHGISHLSQERSRVRGESPTDPAYAAKLVALSVENGADGFMFSVSEKTLKILEHLRENGGIDGLRLYAIVPCAYDYVRLASAAGGVPGLAKQVIKEIVLSGNLNAAVSGLNGILKSDLHSLVKTYLLYELSRIKRSAGKGAALEAILLHQVVTDLCLGLGLDWVFKFYVDYMHTLELAAGFNTGNFVLLSKKLQGWSVCMEDVVIAAPFNKVGFQMVPSKEECEKTLAIASKSNVLAISILAAGYLKLSEAIKYIASLPNIRGVAVGVSKANHANETFRLLKKELNHEGC